MAMRFFFERGMRFFFYGTVGLSMVLVTTPSLAKAFHASGAPFLWPLIVLLAYLLHLFEDTDKPANVFRAGHAAERRVKVIGSGIPSLLPANSRSATIEQG